MLLPQSFDPACPIGTLTEHPRNPRRGDEAAIEASIQAHGFYGAVLVQHSTRFILAGNHRHRVAARKGETVIPALFVDVDDDEALRILLNDNASSDSGTHDPETLAGLLQQLTDTPVGLTGTGFGADSLASLLATLRPNEVTSDPDTIPPEPTISVTQRGDVWLCGPHRVMCGDSTSPADIERLLEGREAQSMVVDPPYGVDYGDTVAFRRSLGLPQRAPDDSYVTNDGLVDAKSLWAASFPLWINRLRKKESAFYCWGPPGPQQIDLGVALRAAGGEIHGSVCWVKSSFSFSRADHKYQHEPCWYGWRADGTHKWVGPNNESSVWEYPKPSASELHPTQKPVELIRRCVRNITDIQGLTIDPFLGSGTTLIAAHLENRVCCGMEINPRYVDVICQRWLTLTGETPTHADTGHPFT